MRRVIISKHQLAVGLQWYMGKSKQTITDLRRAAAKQEGSLDMVAYRQRQYCFGSSGGPVREWLGVRALAASVRVTSPSFLGLFCLEDKDGEFWWVFAMSQGLIIGMGDQVFAKRSDAEEWILSLQGLLESGVAETITCETVDESLHWLTPLISIGPLSRLRGRNGYLRALQPIPGQRRTLIVLGSILVIGALGGVGVKIFLKQQAGKRAVEAARIAMINKEQRKKELLEHPEKHFPQPWLTAPDVNEFVLRGTRALLEVPIASSGWVLKEALFNGQSVIVTWSHEPGADYVHLPSGAKLTKPQEAVSRIKIQLHHFEHSKIALFSREECSRLLYQGTQILGAKLRLTFTAPEKKKIDKVEITCPWMKGQWELSNIPDAMLKDAALPGVYNTIPGFVPEAMAFNKNMWILKGAVYVTAK